MLERGRVKMLSDEEVKGIAASAMDRLRDKFVAEERQRILDAILPVADENGWCYQGELALRAAFPDHEGDFRTSDGFDMNGRGIDGFDRAGMDANGFDREGYNRSGVNREGKDRNGEVANGWTPGSEWCEACGTWHR